MVKRLRGMVLLWLLVASFGVAAAEIVAAEFGVFDASDPKRVVFEQTQVIPHREGQRYGWMIVLRGVKRSVSVREEYLLPSKAIEQRTDTSDGARVVIPMERRSQVSQRQLVPVDGKIYGEWAIGPNEPAGHRHLQVLIEGQPVASFEYDVK